MKIAFFDSGAGGLTVLKTAQALLAGQDYIYFADSDHVPYGEKDPAEVKNYVRQAIDFLAKKNIDALVIACNTATSLMIDELRQKYQFPIFGMEPAIKLAHDQINTKKKILITGTKITIAADRVKKLSDKYAQQADFVALSKLVSWVEKNQFNPLQVYKYLSKMINVNQHYGAIVLGCTHFSFFKKDFQDFFGPKTIIIDGNLGTINHLAKSLNLKTKTKNSINKAQVSFYFSAKKDQLLEENYLKLLARLD